MPQRPFCSIFSRIVFFLRLPGLSLIFFLLAGMTVGYGQPLGVATNTEVGTCGNSNGILTVTVSGGTSPYQVTVTGGPTAVAPFTLTLPASATSVSKTLPGLAAGFYTVSVTDAANATYVTTPEITNLLGPSNAVLDEATPASCLNNDGVVGVTVVGGTAPYTFLYNGATVGTTTGASAYGTASGLPSGNPLTITVQDANGCTLPEQVTVDLDNNLTLLMDNDATLCEGTSRQITVTSNATSFAWSPALGLSSATVEDPVASPTTTTAYTLTVGLGICTGQGSLNIVVLPAPVADAGGPDSTCYGKDINLQGSGGVQYMWTPAAGLSNPTIPDPIVIDPKVSVVYSLVVTDANGCKNLKPSTVNVYVRPPYPVFAGDDTSVMVGQSVPLAAVDVQGVGFNQYVWTPSVGLSNGTISDPTASFSEIGTYTYVVSATAPDGCGGSDSITIKVYALADIFVPSAFTPNNDGHNDLLRAIPVSIRDFKYLTIFNRWGQQVFTTTNAGIGWDGSFNGQEMPTGTYVWMVGGVDYSGRVVEKRGTVILIR
jgi:gliding motility-associated-like protein